MNGRFVLDTNVVIALFDQEPAVLEQIAAAEETVVPVPVLGELFYGAFHSKHATANLARVKALANSHWIVPIDMETARHYGAIKSALLRKGTPIPDNDLWIAALAQQYAATVATRDQHFDAVDNLVIVRW